MECKEGKKESKNTSLDLNSFTRRMPSDPNQKKTIEELLSPGSGDNFNEEEFLEELKKVKEKEKKERISTSMFSRRRYLDNTRYC